MPARPPIVQLLFIAALIAVILGIGAVLRERPASSGFFPPRQTQLR